MTPDPEDHEPGLDAAAWVLGTLSAEDAERFAAHLEGCAECQEEVERLREVADAIADAAPTAAPSRQLRARVLDAVGQEAALFRAAGAGEGRPADRPARPRARISSGSLAVAAVLLVGGGTLLGYTLGDTERPLPTTPQTVTVQGSVTEAGGAPRARAAVTARDGDDAKLVLTDLGALPEDQIYQAWIERPPSGPASTGAYFLIGPTGDATISLPRLRGATRLIVTAEPRGGSRKPALPPVVSVRLPGQP